MQANIRAGLGLLVPLLVFVPGLAAQNPVDVPPELLQAVMPAAQRFGSLEGEPPVIRAYAADSASGQERLIGYLFFTSDLPPEEMGYNGPIDVLVGMDLSGTLTGARVIDYYESLRRSDGDFLRRRGFQEQFQGKHLADPFRVRRDIDGISGATISVAAMARGIRNAARRVASAYITRGTANADLTAEDIASMSWPEVLDRGLAQRLRFEKDGVLRIEILLLRIRDEAMGRALIGPDAWNRVSEQAGDRLPASRPWFVGLDGGLEALFRPQILFLARDADTLRFTTPDYIPLAEPRSGMVDGQLRNHGVLLVDESVDPALPFTWIAAFGTDIGTDSARYPGEGARPVIAAGQAQDSATVTDSARVEPPARPVVDSAATISDTVIPDTVLAVTTVVPETVVIAETDSAMTVAPGAQPGEPVFLDFPDDEEESVLHRSVAQTSWPRFTILAALLALTCVAFFSKRVSIRWAVLGSAVALLGFGGVGFLSVSHITSAIKVGPSVFLEDFTLLLFVAFTVITTLLWGRVFCGYLCPFGALQDLLERIVPRRFQRELPELLHKRALLAKYGILAIVIVPAIAGSTMSIFQYVEPFGTVFFLSLSRGLWIIAVAILAAAAIVPRFYCRYVCPLGASLAVVSVVSPFRIRRVEQCTVCKVCEQDCPTGAITGPTIDFKECVRCNICEVNLIERVGVCRHDMADVTDQLVQLQVRGRRGART